MEQRSPAGPLIGARDTGRDGSEVGRRAADKERTAGREMVCPLPVNVSSDYTPEK